MKRFDEFAKEEARLDGLKVKLDDLLQKEIVINAFRIQDSKFNENKSGKYATVQFKLSDASDCQVFFTGSDVIIEQLEKYKDLLPFLCTIKKINRYYTLS